jgi:hypothetical protein
MQQDVLGVHHWQGGNQKERGWKDKRQWARMLQTELQSICAPPCCRLQHIAAEAGSRPQGTRGGIPAAKLARPAHAAWAHSPRRAAYHGPGCGRPAQPTSQDGVQAQRLLQVFVNKEGLGDGGGVCQPGGLEPGRHGQGWQGGSASCHVMLGMLGGAARHCSP